MNGKKETLIFTCAGAAHSGQVANGAGVRLTQEGHGNLFCVAAVGAAITDKLNRSRAAGRRVVVDGCNDHCARKILEAAELPVDLHIEVTALGIEKQPACPNLVLDSERVVQHVAETLRRRG